MATGTVTDGSLLDILAKLEPGDSLEESLRELLTRKARTELARYRLVDQKLQKAYGVEFSEFKNFESMNRPSSRTEQDYFDWEMAFTMIDELEGTLKTLRGENG